MEGDFEAAPGGPPCKRLLADIRKRWCEWLPELESLCAHTIDRLEFLRKEVASREPHDPLRAQYVKALTFLAKITQRRPLLERLAKCDTIAQFIRHLQQDIDLIAEGLGLSDCEEMQKWRVEWEGDRAKQFRLLPELVANSTDRELVSGGLQGERKLEEVLADFKNELKRGDLPQDQLEFMKATYERVLKYSRINDVSIADWFISAKDLVLDDGPAVDGSFGRVTRAMWFRDGVRQPVMVKQIFSDIVEDVRRPLIAQLEAWYRLPGHPNVLKLYGGNFVGSQHFFVCEDACQGNLRDFVREHGPNWKLLWEVFIQVTEGLVFLHQQGIVHGGLSCNNILLGENNTPKLGDFGLNSIRNVSMSLSSYHVQSENSRWQAPETYEENSTLRFTADVYALGICMIEVLQQDTPVAQQTVLNRGICDLRPEHVSDKTWEFIERLCAADWNERPSLSEAQERMHTLQSQVADFPVSGLREESSLKALRALDARLMRMPENEGLCRQVLSRLQFLHDFVAPLNATDSLKIEYETVIARFAKITHRKPLLSRLADSEKLAVKIQEMQLKLSDVAQGIGVADKTEMTQWELRWDSDRAEQYSKLFELVTGASERTLVNEFQSDKKVQEALMILKNGMKWKDQSPKMLELKQTILSRVRGFLDQTGFCMYGWFIPFDDLECGDTAIHRSRSGEFFKGAWLHDGQRKEVVVKQLYRDWSYNSEDEFIRNMDLWYNIPENEHILKVYGGSHIDRQFYVCEYAPYGSLWEYMADEEHMTQFWQLFLQAAQGLKFLHDRQIIHRNLRCDNILVGENHAVKLADTGKRSEAERQRASSKTTFPRTFESARWQPREMVQEGYYNDEIRFESDIYTLGMCMIEIIAQKPPFGLMVEDEVVEKILSGESYPRPDEVSDRAWDLISRLCDPDFEKRPALEDVIEEIRELAANNVGPRRNPDDSVPPSTPREISDTPSTPSEQDTIQTATCSSCSEASCAFEQWCQYCGNYVCAGNTDVDSQVLLTL